MELMEPPPMHPSYVWKSVLWDIEDCLNPAEGIIITEANKSQPRMAFAICCIDGTLVLVGEFKIIHQVAKAISKVLIMSLLKDEHAVIFNSKPQTKKTLKKYFEPEYNQVCLRLEAHSKPLCLCSAHWKADHMIGQARLSPENHDVDVDVDLTALVAPQQPLWMLCPSKMSPGLKSPSAVHTQKHSKDALIVPGKKLDSEYLSLQNSESLTRLSCNRASMPSSTPSYAKNCSIVP